MHMSEQHGPSREGGDEADAQHSEAAEAGPFVRKASAASLSGLSHSSRRSRRLDTKIREVGFDPALAGPYFDVDAADGMIAVAYKDGVCVYDAATAPFALLARRTEPLLRNPRFVSFGPSRRCRYIACVAAPHVHTVCVFAVGYQYLLHHERHKEHEITCLRWASIRSSAVMLFSGDAAGAVYVFDVSKQWAQQVLPPTLAEHERQDCGIVDLAYYPQPSSRAGESHIGKLYTMTQNFVFLHDVSETMDSTIGSNVDMANLCWSLHRSVPLAVRPESASTSAALALMQLGDTVLISRQQLRLWEVESTTGVVRRTLKFDDHCSARESITELHAVSELKSVHGAEPAIARCSDGRIVLLDVGEHPRVLQQVYSVSRSREGSSSMDEDKTRVQRVCTTRAMGLTHPVAFLLLRDGRIYFKELCAIEASDAPLPPPHKDPTLAFNNSNLSQNIEEVASRAAENVLSVLSTAMENVHALSQTIPNGGIVKAIVELVAPEPPPSPQRTQRSSSPMPQVPLSQKTGDRVVAGDVLEQSKPHHVKATIVLQSTFVHSAIPLSEAAPSSSESATQYVVERLSHSQRQSESRFTEEEQMLWRAMQELEHLQDLAEPAGRNGIAYEESNERAGAFSEHLADCKSIQLREAELKAASDPSTSDSIIHIPYECAEDLMGDMMHTSRFLSEWRRCTRLCAEKSREFAASGQTVDEYFQRQIREYRRELQLAELRVLQYDEIERIRTEGSDFAVVLENQVRSSDGDTEEWVPFHRLPFQLPDGAPCDLQQLDVLGQQKWNGLWSWVDVDWTQGVWQYARVCGR